MLIDTTPVHAAMEPVAVRAPDASDIDALLAFTRACYGKDAHQAQRQRIEWLHQHNPLSRGFSKDVIIAIAGDRVVGCHWKMRLPWRINGERVTVPSAHDLALLAEHRHPRGAGAPPGLLLFGINGEGNSALLGLSAASEALYSALKRAPVPMARMVKILSWPRTLCGVASHNLGWRRKPARPTGIQLEWNAAGYQTLVLSDPAESVLERVLAIPYRGNCHLDWDMATYRWRFFHPLGPKNLLVVLWDGSRPVARAVYSYGVRRGAVMARMVDAAATETAMYPVLLGAVESAMRRTGVAIATAATTCDAARLHLARSGWRVQTGIGSRFYSRAARPLEFAELWGGAYDYGFDAF